MGFLTDICYPYVCYPYACYLGTSCIQYYSSYVMSNSQILCYLSFSTPDVQLLIYIYLANTHVCKWPLNASFSFTFGFNYTSNHLHYFSPSPKPQALAIDVAYNHPSSLRSSFSKSSSKPFFDNLQKVRKPSRIKNTKATSAFNALPP